ncbi:hypothetical protein HanPI659440_Chr16g0651271 [Helianthus annuus]|nr:hypothetical protein HanPI659440_Chr17g0665081 [Helianthus annuus]KAJ0682788.1 hypothetical protein HanPI659440_Chr16g0651271 [Helianthus annuus]
MLCIPDVTQKNIPAAKRKDGSVVSLIHGTATIPFWHEPLKRQGHRDTTYASSYYHRAPPRWSPTAFDHHCSVPNRHWPHNHRQIGRSQLYLFPNHNLNNTFRPR